MLSGVVAGNHPPTQFFYAISSYFGDQGDDFWNDVAFFNFGPRIVGGRKAKYARLRKEELPEARVRFIHVLEQHKPDLLFVFSTKAWKSLPTTLEEERGTSGGDLIPDGNGYDRQHYRTSDGHIVQAFGLRHPQGAKKEDMKRTVASALRMQPNSPS